MASRTTTEQYNPTSALEVATDDGISVRFARDLALGMNNYRYHAGNHQVVTQMFLPYVPSADNTDRCLILYLGKWYIPPGIRRVRWWLNGRLTNPTYTDVTTWTLASGCSFYVGPEVFDSTQVLSYVSSEIDISSSGWDIHNNTLDLGRADFNGRRWFYLLGHNNTGGNDPTTRTELVSINVQPLVT